MKDKRSETGKEKTMNDLYGVPLATRAQSLWKLHAMNSLTTVPLGTKQGRKYLLINSINVRSCMYSEQGPTGVHEKMSDKPWSRNERCKGKSETKCSQVSLNGRSESLHRSDHLSSYWSKREAKCI